VRVVARRTDPETSHQAALQFGADQPRITASIATVVRLLEQHGPLTDFDIRARWSTIWEGPFSFTLPCKARHWARQAGLVKHAGYGTHEGRRVRTWEVGRDAEFLTPRVDPSAARIRQLEDELRNIAEANPSTWDDPADFRAWAQNRARHTLQQVAK
jgi:hypothetical protein